jgi:SAM-dependent methyltransferase
MAYSIPRDNLGVAQQISGGSPEVSHMTVMEQDYLSVNRLAYDRLAEAYRKRAEIDRVKDTPLVQPFVSYLNQTFRGDRRVLDIGPGNGVNLSMLCEAGLSIVGVDISPKMLEVAHAMCPSAELHLGDFLAVPLVKASFHGVFSKASVHCFPKIDAMRAFGKIHELLVPNGMFYVTTTAGSDSSEGFYSKDDYPGGLVRFRKRWTPEELTRAVIDSGFVIHKESYDYEADWHKRWYNIWAVKCT